MLTKAPEEYADSKSLPHVQVALRLNSAAGDVGATKRFRAGDTVEYIVCADGTNNQATQRGYSPAEISSRGASGKFCDCAVYNCELYNKLHDVVVSTTPVCQLLYQPFLA